MKKFKKNSKKNSKKIQKTSKIKSNILSDREKRLIMDHKEGDLKVLNYDEACSHVEEKYYPSFCKYLTDRNLVTRFSRDQLKHAFYEHVKSKRYKWDDDTLIAYNDLLLPKVCSEVINNQ